jgi:hypothetical protein
MAELSLREELCNQMWDGVSLMQLALKAYQDGKIIEDEFRLYAYTMPDFIISLMLHREYSEVAKAQLQIIKDILEGEK